MLVMHITNEGFVSRRYKNFVQTIRGREKKKKEKWAKDRKRQLTKKKEEEYKI